MNESTTSYDCPACREVADAHAREAPPIPSRGRRRPLKLPVPRCTLHAELDEARECIESSRRETYQDPFWALTRLTDVLDRVISEMPRPRPQTEQILEVVRGFLGPDPADVVETRREEVANSRPDPDDTLVFELPRLVVNPATHAGLSRDLRAYLEQYPSLLVSDTVPVGQVCLVYDSDQTFKDRPLVDFEGPAENLASGVGDGSPLGVRLESTESTG